MSILNQIASSLAKGAGWTLGARVGKEAFEAARDRLQQVDWEQLKDGAGVVAERVADVFRGDAGSGDAADEVEEVEASDAAWAEPDPVGRTL